MNQVFLSLGLILYNNIKLERNRNRFREVVGNICGYVRQTTPALLLGTDHH